MTRKASPSNGKTASAAVRERLDHPVIDNDGHMIEIEPVLYDYLAEVAGAAMVDRYKALMKDGRFWGWYNRSRGEVREMRIKRPPHWALAGNTVDRATAMVPRLWRDRMDEFGVDFTIVYPTLGLHTLAIADDELRLSVVRANNLMNADTFRGHEDRIMTVATIPMHTPEEAIEELEFAVQKLGMKAMMMEGVVRRPIETDADGAVAATFWLDPLGMDGLYDYDPLWAKCMELKVAPTTHSHGMGWPNRNSPTNFNYNHIHNFAESSEACCKAMFFGGVTRRFPDLKIGFLECGVAWAVSLYHDIIEHWEKRNRIALDRDLDPANIDRDALLALITEHGHDRVQSKANELGGYVGPVFWENIEDEADLDEWAKCAIETEEDIRDLFVPNFFFGCEADDRCVAWAFDERVNEMNVKFNAMLGSDIGHWDVQDATTVLAESYELVEKNLLSHDDFRDFTFSNAVSMHGGMNPDFFKGTVIEAEADAVLNGEHVAA